MASFSTLNKPISHSFTDNISNNIIKIISLNSYKALNCFSKSVIKVYELKEKKLKNCKDFPNL